MGVGPCLVAVMWLELEAKAGVCQAVGALLLRAAPHSGLGGCGVE